MKKGLVDPSQVFCFGFNFVPSSSHVGTLQHVHQIPNVRSLVLFFRRGLALEQGNFLHRGRKLVALTAERLVDVVKHVGSDQKPVQQSCRHQ